MGIQHRENVPASFSKSFEAGYLGDKAAVTRLVAEFFAGVENLLNGGAANKEDFVAKSNGLIRAYGDIFAGRVEAYKPVQGWNAVSLPGRLRADLGEFWAAQRSKWEDDPVCVFFEWLFVSAAEYIKRADGDDMLLEVMLRPTVEQAINHLLGSEERRIPTAPA